MIYFIKCHEFVKIGRGAMPEDRLNALQTGNPYKIDLMGAFDGSDAEERRIHDAFQQFHHQGEWYYLSGTIRTFIEKHCKRRQASPQIAKPARSPRKRPGRKARTGHPNGFNSERFRSVQLVFNRDVGPVVRNSEEILRGIKLFFSECTEDDETSRIPAAKIYDAYLSWCERGMIPPCTLTAFGRKTRELGIKKSTETSRITYYEDRRLKGDVGIFPAAA